MKNLINRALVAEKRLFFIFTATLLMTANLMAEDVAYDVIYWSNNDSVQAKVLTIGIKEVTYHTWSNLQGPIYTINKSEIIAIRYANGTYDIFDDTYNPVTQTNQQPAKTNEGAFFLGGSGSIGYVGAFNFALEPEIGYEFTDRWAIGTGIGVSVASGGGVTGVVGVVEPFVRLCAWHNELVFIDFKATAGIGFTDVLQLCQVGIRPSLRFRLSEHCDLAADIGLFGAQYTIAAGWQPAFGIAATSAGIWVAYRF